MVGGPAFLALAQAPCAPLRFSSGVRVLDRDTLTSLESNSNSKIVNQEVELRKKPLDVEQISKSPQDSSIKNIATSTSKTLRNATNGKKNVSAEDTISVSSNSALSAAGADSDTSGSRYDNVSERKRLSSDSLSKTSTLVAAAAAIAVANHTSSSTEINTAHQKFEDGKIIARYPTYKNSNLMIGCIF